MFWFAPDSKVLWFPHLPYEQQSMGESWEETQILLGLQQEGPTQNTLPNQARNTVMCCGKPLSN